MIATINGVTLPVEHFAFAYPLRYGIVEHNGFHFKVVKFDFPGVNDWGLQTCMEHPYTDPNKLWRKKDSEFRKSVR